MNRPIKFRARSMDPLVGENQWIYGFGVHVVRQVIGGLKCLMYTGGKEYQVDPKTVGQYTAVWDDEDISDGYPLYEGDIVELEYQGKKHICKIAYCGSGFILHADSLPETYLWLSDIIEFDRDFCWAKGTKRIGNIYEHPHLLK